MTTRQRLITALVSHALGRTFTQKSQAVQFWLESLDAGMPLERRFADELRRLEGVNMGYTRLFTQAWNELRDDDLVAEYEQRESHQAQQELVRQAQEASEMARAGHCPRCHSAGELRDGAFHCPVCRQITWRLTSSC
jgi:hypothetical protein